MRTVSLILRKAKTLGKMDFITKWLVLQTFCLCGIVRLLILTIPFKKIQPYLGTRNEESCNEITLEQYKQAMKVKWVVQSVSRYTPWESKCLVKAIVAQYLLRKKGISTTLYLGACRAEEGGLKAHAWLRCGQVIVTGERSKADYKEVSKFSNEKSKVC